KLRRSFMRKGSCPRKISRNRDSRTPYLVLLVFVCVCAPTMLAQDNWKGGAGNWSNSTKWTAGVPTSTSNAYIYHSNSSASSVTNDTNAQCANLTIDSDDSLSLPTNSILTVFGPTISNAGTLLMNATSSGANFDIAGKVTLTGAGGLTMSNNAGNLLFGYGQGS